MESFEGLLISSPKNFEENAAFETERVFIEELNLEEDQFVVQPIKSFSGLVMAEFKDETGLESIEQFRNLIRLATKESFFYNYILKLVPLQYKMPTEEDVLVDFGNFIKKKLDPESTWRLILRRRNSDLERKTMIEAATKEINVGEVDLEKPQYYVRLEILGAKMFGSLTKIPEFSSVKYERDKEAYLERILMNLDLL